jgi:hypothetical protein
MVVTRNGSVRTVNTKRRTTRRTGTRDTKRTASTATEEFEVVAVTDDAGAPAAHDPELDERRQFHGTSSHFYKVQWEGNYPPSWEVEEDVGLPLLASYHAKQAIRYVDNAYNAIIRAKEASTSKLSLKDTKAGPLNGRKRKYHEVDDLDGSTELFELREDTQKYMMIVRYLAEESSAVPAADVDASHINNFVSGPLTSAHPRNADGLVQDTSRPASEDGTLGSTVSVNSIDANAKLEDVVVRGKTCSKYTEEGNAGDALALTMSVQNFPQQTWLETVLPKQGEHTMDVDIHQSKTILPAVPATHPDDDPLGDMLKDVMASG